MHIHANDPNGRRYYVYLDGKFVEYCVEADEEEGWADCYETKSDGSFVLVTRNDAPEVNTIRYYGRVELKLVEWRKESCYG